MGYWNMKVQMLSIWLAVLLGHVGLAEAGTIDLMPYATASQGRWGEPSPLLYAQSIVADDSVLSEVRMSARSMEINDIQFNILVTGTRPTIGGLGLLPDMTDIRFNSGLLTIPLNAGFLERAAYPDVRVNVGETVFLVFDTFSYPSSGAGQMRATPYNGQTDRYPPGEFVYCGYRGASPNLEGFNAMPWEHRSGHNQDLGIKAVFVPEPAAMFLLGLGGLVMIRRRR